MNPHTPAPRANMTDTGDDTDSTDPAALAAIALFHTIASVRPPAGRHAARRVVLADLLTRHLAAPDRATALTACLLADIGRVVLRLPGGEAAERGGNLLRAIAGLEATADAVSHRHERVDGAGVPAGLAGHEIPLGARVVALTDLLVGTRRATPIDWERRIELMKDSAGTSLDVDLSDQAFDLLRSSDVRSLVEAATAGMATAIVEQVTTDPHGEPLRRLGSLVETMGDPIRTASVLVEATRAAAPVRAVGVHRVEGTLLMPVHVAGEGAGRSAFGLPDSLRELRGVATTVWGRDRLVVVPVRADGLWGIAWAIGDGDDLDVRPLTELAAGLETTVLRARDRQRLDLLAHGDELTGLAIRRRLEIELAQLYEGPPSTRADAALVMCDVDGLKRVNDTRGHGAGDDVLRAVALVLRGLAADHDALATRLGGDEFCLLVRTGGLLHAQHLTREAAEQVRRSVPAGVGLSCGIAYAARADSPSELLSQADEAQYLVKRRRPSPGPRRRRPHDRRRRPDR